MNWEDLSENALHIMRELGNFGPTVNPLLAEVKGYTLDCNDGGGSSTYYGPDELRDIASACTEVADWLTRRREAAQKGIK